MEKAIIEGSAEECQEKSAKLISEKIKELADKQERIILGFSDTKNITGLLNRLSRLDLPWKKVHIFMIDEKCVSLNSLESNYRNLDQNLIQELIKLNKISPLNLHPFVYNPENAFGSLRHYDNEHVRFGGKFDIIITSTEKEGQIASLFPNHHTIKNESTRFFLIQDSPRPPTKRMTASKKMILQSKVAILIITGKDTDNMAKRFEDKSTTLVACPAKLITQIPENHIFREI